MPAEFRGSFQSCTRELALEIGMIEHILDGYCHLFFRQRIKVTKHSARNFGYRGAVRSNRWYTASHGLYHGKTKAFIERWYDTQGRTFDEQCQIVILERAGENDLTLT